MRHVLINLLFLVSSAIAIEPTLNKKITTSLPSASINISLNNNHDFSSHNATLVSNGQIVKIPQSPPSQESPVFNKIAELWHDGIKERLQEKSSNFLSTYKWHLLGAGLLGSYALLCYFIVSGNYYLGDTQLWSSWHQELPLDQLLSIPQQQLSQDLLREIQRRYTDAESLIDIIKPLGLFMSKIDQEEEQLKWYQMVYSWISYAHINQLVPFSKNRFAKINERLQRVAYYKNVFKSWAAEYQLQQSKKAFEAAFDHYPEVAAIGKWLHIETKIKILDYWAKAGKNSTKSIK